jgi:hypothetical protein
MSTRPTLAEVRTYIGVPATVLADEDLERIYNAADESQRKRCNGFVDLDGVPVDDLPDPLNQAFLRRVQREVAARNLPLGMVGIDAEYGAQRLPMSDSLVDDAERPYRKQVVG